MTGQVDVVTAGVTAEDIEKRAAVTFLNYPRNTVDAIAAVIKDKLAMGPTTIGEALYPVSATYSSETGITRVGFSFLAPPADLDDEALA